MRQQLIYTISKNKHRVLGVISQSNTEIKII